MDYPGGSTHSTRRVVAFILAGIVSPTLGVVLSRLDDQLLIAFLLWGIGCSLSLAIVSGLRRACIGKQMLLRSLVIISAVVSISTGIYIIKISSSPRASIEARAINDEGYPCSDIDVNAIGKGPDCVGRATITDGIGHFLLGGLESTEHFVVMFKVAGDSVFMTEFTALANGRGGPIIECPFPSNTCVMSEFDPVHFERDSARLDRTDKKTLVKVAYALNNDPKLANCRLLIHGHCDAVGSVAYNLDLGARRARAVRDELVDLVVSPGRIMMVSYGMGRPAVAGDSKEAYAQNRRVECMVLPYSAKYNDFLVETTDKEPCLRLSEAGSLEGSVFISDRPSISPGDGVAE